MNEKIIEYIKTGIAQGKSKEEIYKELLTQGSSVELIQSYFNEIASEQTKEDTQKKTIRIILTIAGVLIGAGIFSFIASNWQGMDKAVKIMVILAALLTSYSASWYFTERQHLSKTGETFLLLGSIIYGAGIFLVAQIFNIRANWPDGFILWMLGTVAMAFATGSFSLFYLAILLGIISIIGHPFAIFSSPSNSFLLTSSLLLIIATISTFITGMSIRKKMPETLKNIY